MIDRKRKLAFIMAWFLLLAGCAKEQDIPELIEPVVNNESYRPVEYGGVAKTETAMADVVPEEYCHFMKEAAKVSEITVDLGQHVEAGELLAVMDVTELKAELSAKEKELELEQTLYSYQKKICDEQVKEQKLKKQDYKKSGAKEEAAACDTQIALLEENRRYDALLEKHKETMLREEIAGLQERVEEGSVKASHAGYVTYVKNLEISDQAAAYENVVIVSDYDALHLELQEDISKDLYTEGRDGTYDEIYTLLNGRQCSAEIYTYSNQELIAIQSAGLYPKIRLEADNLEKSVSPGDKIPVYFKSSSAEHILRIGMDSLYNTGNHNFVYVKNGDGREKREVRIGYHNDIYAEVTEGLKEGEWIYYSSNAIMPEQYEELTVAKQDYAPSGSGLGVRGEPAYTQIYSYAQQEDAVVESVYFAKGDKVNKGDVICTLKTKPGKAKLKEMEQNLSALREEHKEALKEYDRQLKELDGQIAKAKEDYARQKKREKEETRTEQTTEENVEEASEQAATEENQAEGIMEQIATEENQAEGIMEQTVTEEKQTVEIMEQAAEEAQAEGTEDGQAEDGKESANGQTVSETLARQLECQKNVVLYEKKSAQAQYDYSYSDMQRKYDNAVKVNDGSGKQDICAKQSGIVGNLNIYENKKIKAEKDPNLFQIYAEDSKKYSVNTKSDYVGAGSKVTIRIKDSGKEYESKVIGNSAARGKVYVTTREQKVYVTRSDSLAEGSYAYITIPEDIQEETEGAEISYASVSLRDVVVLPAGVVNEEVNALNPDIIRYYVWKIVEGNFVKQYVQLAETLNTEEQVCVLEGLESGDILANPVVNQK